MSREGKAPLDRARDTAADRAAAYAALDRRNPEPVSAREMALIRRRREEETPSRAKTYLDIDRRGETA